MTLVDLRTEPLHSITARGILAGDVEHELDCIVYATGFDAMTGSLAKIDIRGPQTSLAEAWAEGPKTYLGLMVAGLPNLFIITGPGSPSVLTNMIASIEYHVEWIADCLASLSSVASPEWKPQRQRPGLLGGSRQQRRLQDAVPNVQLLVPRSEHPRQDPCVHAPTGPSRIRRALQRRSSSGLSELRAFLTRTNEAQPMSPKAQVGRLRLILI